MLDNLTVPVRKRLIAAAQAELAKRRQEVSERGDLERSLVDFHKGAWPRFDPAPYVHNWHIDGIADHLTGVMHGHIPKLLITEPPRTMKSSMVCCSFPAYVWSQQRYLPLSGPHVKFIGVAYDPKLALRDALKARRIIDSPWYQDRWADRFSIRQDRDQKAMYENTAGGFRFSTSVSGGLTGEGGDILIVDDPINAKKALWESARASVNQWWDETVPTRLNNLSTGAMVVIMQRLHEDDLVGHILDSAPDDWVHLNLPMEYDPAVDTRTYVNGTLFFEDPRTEEGELLWPERFPAEAIEKLKVQLGPFAAAAQLQQQPTPRGGGIIDRLWWNVWDEEAYAQSMGAEHNDGILRFPRCSLIVGSVDTAYGEKDENAYNAVTVWGVFQDRRARINTVMMEAFRGRWKLRGIIPDDLETEEERKPHWGLAERIADCVRRRHIDILLIENKTRGADLENELRRLLRGFEVQLLLLEPEGNKVARLHAVQPMFADGRVYAPDKTWADTVITEVSQFPKSKYADYTDTVSQTLSWMRNNGVLLLGTEADAENTAASTFRSKGPAKYDV